jgi:hypothetical protein
VTWLIQQDRSKIQLQSIEIQILNQTGYQTGFENYLINDMNKDEKNKMKPRTMMSLWKNLELFKFKTSKQYNDITKRNPILSFNWLYLI